MENKFENDAVSRQAVLNALYALCDTGETFKDNPWRDNPHIDAVTDTIEQLPSVTPARKKGNFTRQELENWLYSICLNNVGTDFCKDIEEIISRLDGFERYVEDMRCGAKMEGESE